MDRVRRGETPWRNLDALHRASLDTLAPRFGLAGLDEAAMDWINRGWHRLRPWPDSVPGLVRLKRGFILSPLSNGGVALLTNMAKQAGLPWDLVLCAEVFRHYKPDPETYLGAARLLDLPPEQVMLCAAHNSDLAPPGVMACAPPSSRGRPSTARARPGMLGRSRIGTTPWTASRRWPTG